MIIKVKTLVLCEKLMSTETFTLCSLQHVYTIYGNFNCFQNVNFHIKAVIIFLMSAQNID